MNINTIPHANTPPSTANTPSLKQITSMRLTKPMSEWFFVWSFVVLFLSCRVLCGVVLVVCLCVWPVSLLTKPMWEVQNPYNTTVSVSNAHTPSPYKSPKPPSLLVQTRHVSNLNTPVIFFFNQGGDTWPIHEIMSLVFVCARINPPFLTPPPFALLTLLQYYCETFAPYMTSRRPSLCMPYTIQYWSCQYRVKAKVVHNKRGTQSLYLCIQQQYTPPSLTQTRPAVSNANTDPLANSNRSVF